MADRTSGRMRIVSGIRPTGRLHLGHLRGALRNWLRAAGSRRVLLLRRRLARADHRLRGHQRHRASTRDMVLDWLAVGLDPQQRRALRAVGGQGARRAAPAAVDDRSDAVAAAQSDGQGAGARARPDQRRRRAGDDQLNYGLLGYPVLQSADVLLYRARGVPVGVDQVPHLELTREIARRFNRLYGEVFPEPEALLTESPKIPGTDGRKMSKSYNNAVFLDEPAKDIDAKLEPHDDRPAPRAPHRPRRAGRLPGVQPAPHLLHAGRDRVRHARLPHRRHRLPRLQEDHDQARARRARADPRAPRRARPQPRRRPCSSTATCARAIAADDACARCATAMGCDERSTSGGAEVARPACMQRSR